MTSTLIIWYFDLELIDRFHFSFSDNDRSSLNCASMLKGGWWWKSCGRGLNGVYLSDPQDLTARQGTFPSTLISFFPLFLSKCYFILLRHCLVPLARMGLLAQAITNDDQTQELEWKQFVRSPASCQLFEMRVGEWLSLCVMNKYYIYITNTHVHTLLRK